MNGIELVVIVERPRAGFVYPCTVDDVLKVLRRVPHDDLAPFRILEFRQPTRKQGIFEHVWGMMYYKTSIDSYIGPSIYLTAQHVRGRYEMEASLTPPWARELERLRREGHRVETGKRKLAVLSDLDAMRNTQLFRTVPHEIGHYVDYVRSVVEPSGGDATRHAELWSQHLNKAGDDSEAFADRYAERFNRREAEAGNFPFSRTFGDEVQDPRLKRSWFGL